MATKKSTVKPAAKPKETVVSDVDPLADLGLDPEPVHTTVDTAQETPITDKPVVETTVSKTVTKKTTEPTNEEVEVGEIEFGFSEFVPTAKRKAEGSKYKFDQLVAPGVFEDGPHKGKPKFANFVVKLQPGVDPDKLRRSVQSATTQANRQGSDEGKYFVSRSLTKDGQFAGMIVYRTDAKAK